jgi:ABC-type Fe3+-hydroxamate transport system substrate-binding protein
VPVVTDDRGVQVVLDAPPRRIVSLVPSTTDTLFALGLGDAVVGVTRFCVHPADRVRGLPRVGGTKDVDAARVAELEPDLILGNCEENTREIFTALQGVAPLYAALPRTVDDAAADLHRLAAITGAQGAPAWLDRLAAVRDRLRAIGARGRVAWLVWNDPLMTISADTFLSSALREAGYTPVFDDRQARYPIITSADLRAAKPDLVLLSSEPYPFQPRHADALARATGLPRDRFRWASGELSWHGTRMVSELERLTEPDPFPAFPTEASASPDPR